MRKLLLVLFFFIFLFFPSSTLAASDFSTNYNVKYTISENQNTRVQIDVTLINKTDIYYASSYKIHAGFSNIQNVRATDRLGNILKSVSDEDDDKVISVEFNDKASGLNSKLDFSISFETSDVAKKLGSIWEVNIPGLSSKSDISNFNVSVIVPKSLGSASFIKPFLIPTGSGNVYNFTRNDLGTSGISMTFGQVQIYKLNLVYHLQNKNLFPIRTEIALPPDTNYQEAEINQISSNPDNVIIDKDGNWLAEYTLKPSEKKVVVVDASIRLKLKPQKSKETEAKLKEYLMQKEYWEINDPNIKEQARKLKTPFEIYKFVSKHLQYDYSRLESEDPRLGASKTYKNPSSAVCLEFTDLFIAIARAAGIPAREIDGFAYTQNSRDRPASLIKDVLHAWPEFYDREKETWVMIDPTWANTTGGLDYFDTLDFDHIAFVIKGQDSTYPVSAGGYKLSGGASTKDVNVSFAGEFEDADPTVTVRNDFPDKLIAGFSSKGLLEVENTGKRMSPKQLLVIDSNFLTPKRQVKTIERIPPYGNISIPIEFDKSHFLTNREAKIKIMLDGSLFASHTIKISPLFLNEWSLLIGGIIFGIFIIIASLIALKPWNLSFFRRKG